MYTRCCIYSCCYFIQHKHTVMGWHQNCGWGEAQGSQVHVFCSTAEVGISFPTHFYSGKNVLIIVGDGIPVIMTYDKQEYFNYSYITASIIIFICKHLYSRYLAAYQYFNAGGDTLPPPVDLPQLYMWH